ncbi:hypothetical protein E2C01_038749 [Portunus trituberculatus]|uniref:Uncharacterized protein n=1 Tax=Portunus trituberculatus TaxID=210409 RepID=A0A5B7FKW9_PORTR|nr:hypothetical protein [Portunus trituberculatus]
MSHLLPLKSLSLSPTATKTNLLQQTKLPQTEKRPNLLLHPMMLLEKLTSK